MEKLSLQSYVSKCVLGAEVAYAGCIIYAFTLSGALREGMFRFFEFIPGFSLGVIGFVLGGVSIGVISVILGSYMVWMHNSSVINK